MTESSACIEALNMLSEAASWRSFDLGLRERGLDAALSAAEKLALLDVWLQKAARDLDDGALARELAFWADGGTYAAHLAGRQAVPPPVLLADAARRGWFVKALPSGTVVNPPEGGPLMLRRGADLLPE